MNLKNNKGYTGIDISVAMIIILIFIPTIFGIVYNIQKTNSYVERESQAVKIATDILETAKTSEYDNLNITNLYQELISKNYSTSTYTINGQTGENYRYLSKTGSKDEHYQIQIKLENYYPEDVDVIDREDLVKKIKVTVIYPTGNTTKTIDICTLIKNS